MGDHYPDQIQCQREVRTLLRCEKWIQNLAEMLIDIDAMYHIAIISALLYGSRSWTLNCYHVT